MTVLLDRVLVDTHVLLWWLADSDRLGPSARELIVTTQRVVVSVVSAVEIAIKTSVGKLQAPADLPDQLAAQGFDVLPLTLGHAMAISTLPVHHRDPFDRMLVAQAMVENLPVLTADARLNEYAVQIVDARA